MVSEMRCETNIKVTRVEILGSESYDLKDRALTRMREYRLLNTISALKAAVHEPIQWHSLAWITELVFAIRPFVRKKTERHR